MEGKTGKKARDGIKEREEIRQENHRSQIR